MLEVVYTFMIVLPCTFLEGDLPQQEWSRERMNRLLVKAVLSMLLIYISSKTNAFFL